ncbi:MAG: 4'-phosphopantetheinyl transferase superfamily protein [Halieaceae bacterium]
MTLNALLPDLAGPDLAIAWAALEALPGNADPLELEDIASAALPRRREFVAGRLIARMLSDQLGLPPAPVRRADDRSPVWPADRVGSLSHCDTLCAAAIGTSHAIRSVGIDIETIGRVEPKLWPTLFTEREADYFTSLTPERVAMETTLFFSAKESFYKCQYPLTQSWVGFQDVEVARTDEQLLAITPTSGTPQPWHDGPIHTVEITDAHIVTVMLLGN